MQYVYFWKTESHKSIDRIHGEETKTFEHKLGTHNCRSDRFWNDRTSYQMFLSFAICFLASKYILLIYILNTLCIYDNFAHFVYNFETLKFLSTCTHTQAHTQYYNYYVIKKNIALAKYEIRNVGQKPEIVISKQILPCNSY